MTRLNIQLPVSLKAKLDTLKAQGTSASGLIPAFTQSAFRPASEERKVKKYPLRRGSDQNGSHKVGNE
jgi:hypothetical protein